MRENIKGDNILTKKALFSGNSQDNPTQEGLIYSLFHDRIAKNSCPISHVSELYRCPTDNSLIRLL
jgi:hypothetical protein